MQRTDVLDQEHGELADAGPVPEQPLYRTATLSLERASFIVDVEGREFRTTVSSEEPYLRKSWFEEPWIEVLGHKRTEVDLGRLQNGAPLLFMHQRVGRTLDDRPHIGVVTSAKLLTDTRKIEITAKLSRREQVSSIWQDIQDGIIRNVSIGYDILERKLVRRAKNQPDEYRVTRWLPHEVSLVDIPADQTVGIGRVGDLEENALAIMVAHERVGQGKSFFYRMRAPVSPAIPETEETTVDEVTKAATTGGNADGTGAAPAPAPTPAAADVAASETAVAKERARIASITLAFSAHDERKDVRELMQRCIAEGVATDVAAKRLDELLGKDTRPLGADVQPGVDAREKMRAGMLEAILHRSRPEIEKVVGRDRAPKAEISLGNEFRGLDLYGMARECLRAQGLPLSGSKMDVVGRAFTSTSDYPSILADVSNKSLLAGYEGADETHQLWTVPGTLPNFRAALRTALSEFPALMKVNEGGEFKRAYVTDRGEFIQLATYGFIFAITRQAIINDDLSAFSRIPASQGRAARATEANIVYGVLTANGAMAEDGVALFHASHNNLMTGGDAGKPSVITVGAARNRLATMKHTANDATTLGIRLRALLVPLALADTANVLRASEFDPANIGAQIPNPVRGTFDVIAERRLDADSVTRWYAVGDRNTVELAFLDGQTAPVLEQQNGWNIDGVEFKVRHDIAAAALDWRTMIRNDGA